MSVSTDRAQLQSRNEEQGMKPRRFGRIGKFARFLPIMLLVGVLTGAVYAGFVATHTFTFPSTTAGILNKAYTITFEAQVTTPALTTCGSNPCFTVTSPSALTVSTYWTLSGGAGVTITLIYIIPLTASCSLTQPTNTTGLFVVSSSAQSPSIITLSGGTDYDYCIYYTSATNVATGTLFINYSAS